MHEAMTMPQHMIVSVIATARSPPCIVKIMTTTMKMMAENLRCSQPLRRDSYGIEYGHH